MNGVIERVKKGLEENQAQTIGGIVATLLVSLLVWSLFTTIMTNIFPWGIARFFILGAGGGGVFWLVFFTFMGIGHYIAYFNDRVSNLWLPRTDGESRSVIAEPSTAAQTLQSSSTALNPDGTHPDVSHPKPAPKRYVEVRKTPKGTRIRHRSADYTILEIKCAIRFWYWFLPACAGGGVYFLPPILAAVTATRPNEIPMLWTLWTVLMIGVALVASVMTRPWVKVTVTPTDIQFGSKLFDRQHHWGMTIGYTLEGRDANGENIHNLKNDFHDLSLGLSAIRLTYGRWGEDLPYLVNKYHAAEIIVWMNEIIAEVGAPPAPAHDIDQGRKVETF